MSSSQLRLTKTGVWLAPNNRVSTRVSTGRGVDVDAGGARSPLLTPQSTGEAEEQSPEPQREDEAAAEERGADDATAERQVREDFAYHLLAQNLGQPNQPCHGPSTYAQPD